jgi:hypothetical protein
MIEDDVFMPERSRRHARALGSHRDDRIVEP